jgi:hypothetical protein
MTHDPALQVICVALYIIGGLFTAWGALENKAPRKVALFLGITFPFALFVCGVYVCYQETFNKGTKWKN